MDALADLRSAIDGLHDLDPAGFGDGELSELLVELHRESDRLASAQVDLVGAWDARRVWARDRAKSGGAWLRHRCQLPSHVAHGEVRLARRLRAMEPTAKALAAGEIGLDAAHGLARANRPEVASVFARDEKTLLDAARTLSFRDFQRSVGYWRQLAELDRVEDDAADLRDRRELHHSPTLDGMGVLNGTLDPVGSAAFGEELTRLERELFEADWSDAKERLGDAVTLDDLARTPAQRRADALVEMAVRSAAMPPGARKPRPLISVLVGYETFAGRTCELFNATIVTPGQVAALLEDADIERIVFDGPSRVLDVGATQRFFTGATRRAIEIRDSECIEPGCDTPAHRCEADHLTPFTEGGPTIQANGGMRCPRHHRHKTRGP